MSVRKKDNPDLYAKIEEHNLLRQYDLLSNCIEIGLEKGIESFALGSKLRSGRKHRSDGRTLPRRPHFGW